MNLKRSMLNNLGHGLGILGILLAASVSQAKLEVHEWGTFTSLVGSNGVTQNGMYHEDEALPSFVHGFGELGSLVPAAAPAPAPVPAPTPRPKCHGKGCFGMDFLQANVITQKMETPVLYFYTDQPQRVSVNVKFPQGIITETYPGPIATFPAKSETPVIANGDTTFIVDVLKSTFTKLRGVEAGNIYAHARNVASNVVQTGDEKEKFIFYRGLGRFQPGMKITSKNGELNLISDLASLPQAVFLVDVDQTGHGNVLELGSMAANTVRTVSRAEIAKLQDHSGQTPSSHALIQPALERAGLKTDEAKAMLDTWNHGYLQVPGLRLLYVLSDSEVEKTLPLTVTPKPDSLERVFVGRIEVLLDTEEQRILKEIQVHGENFRVASLGRFAEPMLRRVMEVHEATSVPVYPEEQVAHRNLARTIKKLVDQASGAVAGELIVQ